MAVAPGSVDFLRDTVYRVGSEDPSGFFTQSQLNNNMSGNDANAIYAATHSQSPAGTYNDSNYDISHVLDENRYYPKQVFDPYNWDSFHNQFNDDAVYDPSNWAYTYGERFLSPGAARQAYLRDQGLKVDTGRQVPGGSNAYVTGADGYYYPDGGIDVLPGGVGSFEGIPKELLKNTDPVGDLYAAMLQAMMSQGKNPEIV